MSAEEKNHPRRPITEKKKTLDVSDHQIHQNFATDVIGVSFDAQNMKFSGVDMESP